MRSLIHDVLDDPREYLPALLFLAGLLMIWATLCVIAFLSIRAAKPSLRFWFALASVTFGLIGVLSQIPFSINSAGFEVNFDLGWCFIVPLLLGVVALLKWWRARRSFA